MAGEMRRMHPSKEAKAAATMIVLSIIGVILVIYIGEGNGKNDPLTAADRRVEEMEAQMVAGTLPLYLDRSELADIVYYMGRSADQQERGPGNSHLMKYRMDDGSWLVFALKPTSGDGLALNHIRAE